MELSVTWSDSCTGGGWLSPGPFSGKTLPLRGKRTLCSQGLSGFWNRMALGSRQIVLGVVGGLRCQLLVNVPTRN